MHTFYSALSLVSMLAAVFAGSNHRWEAWAALVFCAAAFAVLAHFERKR